MVGKRCEVAQLRWFEDGVRWSYHSWFEERDRLPVLNKLLMPQMAALASGNPLPICVRGFKGWIVGERIADATPPDQKAVDRGGAFILRVAYLEQKEEPSAGEQAEIRGQLRTLPAPQTGGKNELIVRLPPRKQPAPPKSPAKPESQPAANRVSWPWFSVALFGIGGTLIVAADLIGALATRSGEWLIPPRSWIAALGGVLVSIALQRLWRYGWLLAESPLGLARRLEAAWDAARKLQQPGDWLRIAPDWYGVLAGRVVHRPGLSRAEGAALFAQFPPIKVEEKGCLLCQSGSLLIVQGGAASPVSSGIGSWLHIFRIRPDGWQLVFAGQLPPGSTVPVMAAPIPANAAAPGPPVEEPPLARVADRKAEPDASDRLSRKGGSASGATPEAVGTPAELPSRRGSDASLPEHDTPRATGEGA